MIKYGFFNKNEKYFSETFTSIFGDLITRGILTGFEVLPYSNNVTVNPGMAFFDDVWIHNDSQIIIYMNDYIDGNINNYKVRHAILLFIDKECKNATIEVITGTKVLQSSEYIDPTISDDKYLLAYVDVEVYDGDIDISIRDMRGTDYCPYCYCGSKTWMSIDTMLDVFRRRYEKIQKDISIDEETLNRYKLEHIQFLREKESEFDIWLNDVKDEVQEWLDNLDDPGLTPEQIAAILSQLETIRSTYVSRFDVNDSLSKLNDPDTVPTSRLVYKVYEQQKPLETSTINITLEDEILFGKSIHVTGPNIDTTIMSDNTGHATFVTTKTGAYTFTITY